MRSEVGAESFRTLSMTTTVIDAICRRTWDRLGQSLHVFVQWSDFTKNRYSNRQITVCPQLSQVHILYQMRSIKCIDIFPICVFGDSETSFLTFSQTIWQSAWMLSILTIPPCFSIQHSLECLNANRTFKPNDGRAIQRCHWWFFGYTGNLSWSQMCRYMGETLVQTLHCAPLKRVLA